MIVLFTQGSARADPDNYHVVGIREIPAGEVGAHAAQIQSLNTCLDEQTKKIRLAQKEGRPELDTLLEDRKQTREVLASLQKLLLAYPEPEHAEIWLG